MSEEKIEELLELKPEKYVLDSDIPDISLYMEQIISLMENKFGEKVMTKTMINNYSKAKIIQPVKGKTYDREQITQILMIAILKNTLTMQSMKKVMQSLYSNDEMGNDVFSECYKEFLKDNKNNDEQLKQITSNLICPNQNLSEEKRALVSLLMISDIANNLQKIAQSIVDNCYDVEK